MKRRTTFHDPAGYLVIQGGEVHRFIHENYLEEFAKFESIAKFNLFRESGQLVWHRHVDIPEVINCASIGNIDGKGVWIQHPLIEIPVYPEEWTFGMLRDAAELTLLLEMEANRHGMELKDAHPRNILFQGCKPIHVDVTSFRSIRSEGIWVALDQFIRCFLLPLYFHSRMGIRHTRIFSSEPEGLDLEEAWGLLSPYMMVKRPFFQFVTLPHLLKKIDIKVPNVGPEVGRRLVQSRLRGLLGLVQSCPDPKARGEWSGYTSFQPYEDAGKARKIQVFQEVMGVLSPGCRLLDVGANTGEFSILAASQGFRVVAVDQDERCLDTLWKSAKSSCAENVLPLVANLTRPTPGRGWNNDEFPSLLERFQNRFELVVALAVIHHMRFTGGIPFEDQLRMFHGLTRSQVLVEWIDAADPMILQMVERFQFLPEDYDRQQFECSIRKQFEIIALVQLPGGSRWIYHLTKKHA